MRTTIPVLILVAAATGCSDGGDNAKPDRVDSRGLASCRDAWVRSKVLRVDYLGCTDGAEVTDTVLDCDDRVRKLAYYDGRYYAFVGENIHDYEQEWGSRLGWGRALTACQKGS